MAKPKKEEVIEEEVVVTPSVSAPISPIEVSFGNGDLNLLKEKINEIIARL